MMSPAWGPARATNIASCQQTGGYTSSYIPPAHSSSYIPPPQSSSFIPPPQSSLGNGLVPSRNGSLCSPMGTAVGSQVPPSPQQVSAQQPPQPGGLQQLVAWAQQQQNGAVQQQQQQMLNLQQPQQQRPNYQPPLSSRPSQPQAPQPPMSLSSVAAPAASAPVVATPIPKGVQAQSNFPNGVGNRLSSIPTPARSEDLRRARSLYLDDRQTLACTKAPTSRMLADAAGGNSALEAALQVLLNVQRIDQKILAEAMLSPMGGCGGLDAMALMQKLTEPGPKILNSEQRLCDRVKSLGMHETVNLLKDFGLDDQGIQDTLSGHSNLDSVHEDIIQVLKEAPPAGTLADAVSATVEVRLRKFLERRGVTRYSDHIISLRHDDESWASVWQRLWMEYPSRPLPGPLAAGCEHRAEMRVLVIGPGFGLLATPHMIDMVRSAGYQLLELPELPNLETVTDPSKVQQAVQALQCQIANFRPHVICAASKGGLYFQHLWRDPNWSISCVLINAHPSITQLPRDAPVIVTQGSRDETFNRIEEFGTILLDNDQIKNGVLSNVRYCPLRMPGDSPALVVQKSLQVPQIVAGGQVQMKVVPAGAVLKPEAIMYGQNLCDASQLRFTHLVTYDDLATLKVPVSISYRHGREDLEDLARTGVPDKTFLYLSTSGISVRPGKPPAFTRKGDGHAAPESLCKDDTLPRLIDAAASGKPEDSLHESWALRVPEERRAGENYLGLDPEVFRRLWTGPERPGGLGCRYAVPADSDEFFAVEQIFRCNPADKVYNFGHDWAGKQIRRIDRVQAPGQLDAIDTYYQSVQNSLESQGTCFLNGVHTRWLFHGSKAIDAIISDALNGFKTTLSKTTLWGTGSYFARDAQYPDDHGFFGEPRPDGTKDMLLCLVVTGMSVLGDESYAIMPYRPGTHHRYNSFVDSVSDPEIFVVSNSAAVLPAYVITYA